MIRPACVIAVFALVALTGCGPRNFRNENDKLRAQVHDLNAQVDVLSARNAELESALAAASNVPDSIPDSVRASLPLVASIELGRLSFARDSDEDGRADVAVLYVQPADGLGRFTQMTGRLSAHVAALPAGADAITLGRVELEPAELRSAYRSSITGTHYTIEVPLSVDAAPETTQQAIARVEFVDGLSGRSFTAERSIRLDEVAADETPSTQTTAAPPRQR